jgi:hypothetical protein
MGMRISSALAVPFSWTSAGTGLDASFTIATVVYPVTVPSIAATRLLLAPSTSEFIAHVLTAFNAGIVASGRTFTLTMGEDARLVLAIDSGTFEGVISLDLNRVLGFLSIGPATITTTADTPPWYLATFASITGGQFDPVASGAFEATAGGVVYGFAGTNTSYRTKRKVAFIPRTPAVRVARGDAQSAWWPDDAYINNLGGTSVAREWAILDVLRVARGGLCGFALGNFQALRTSTSETFWQVYVGPSSLINPVTERHDESWPVYHRHELALVLPTTGAIDDRA